MKPFCWMVALTIALWWARPAPAATPQQMCHEARVTAWKRYLLCIDRAVAKEVAGASVEEFLAFTECRHAYFKEWSTLQAMDSLQGSSCIGNRFTDSGVTVADNLSGLVWEKKTRDGGVHDVGNLYTWSTE